MNSARLKSQFVDKNPYAICICDGEGRYLESNDRHKEMFRFDEIPSDVVASYCLFNDPLLEKSGLLHLLGKLRDGETVRLPEIRYNPRDLSTQWPDCPMCIGSVCFPLVGDEGRIERIVIMYEDLTSLKRTQEEVERIRRFESLAQMAGGVAHDMNNYLMAIVGHLELANQKLRRGMKPEESLSAVQAATLRLASLATRLLTFAKTGAPTRTPHSLVALLNETTKFWLQGTAIDINYELDDPLWPILGDVTELGQVFQNLVINACQAMGNQGRLHIAARNLTKEEAVKLYHRSVLKSSTDSHFVCIEIEDSGPGIPDEVRDRIFTPFYSTKKEGSGLGLATVQTIVTRHMGWVECPPNPAGGAKFVVILPALPGVEMQSKVTLGAAPGGNGRVLLVDDEAEVLDITAAMLAYIGYTVSPAKRGEEAVRILTAEAGEEPIRIAVIDLTLRGEAGGPEILKKLRVVNPELPAILISGFPNHPQFADYEKFGFQSALAKPFTIRQLGERMAEILSAADQARSNLAT